MGKNTNKDYRDKEMFTSQFQKHILHHKQQFQEQIPTSGRDLPIAASIILLRDILILW